MPFKPAVLSAPIGLALLSACATADGSQPEPVFPPPALCNADAVQNLIGQRVTQALGASAMQASGAEILRWIPPDTAVTMDFRQNRLNILYDRDLVVTDINCG